jgi:hypothetical protein
MAIPRGRPLFVIPASLTASFVAGLLAQRVAPAGWGDAAAMCAAWAALYPIPRLIPKIPWWWHWMQGVFIMLGFWFVTRSTP